MYEETLSLRVIVIEECQTGFCQMRRYDCSYRYVLQQLISGSVLKCYTRHCTKREYYVCTAINLPFHVSKTSCRVSGRHLVGGTSLLVLRALHHPLCRLTSATRHRYRISGSFSRETFIDLEPCVQSQLHTKSWTLSLPASLLVRFHHPSLPPLSNR